jgi:hypothetical protein
MAIKLIKADGTILPVTPAVAHQVRSAYLHPETYNEKQQAFTETIKCIVYAPEDVFCLHRYTKTSSFPIGPSSTGYIYTCDNCKKHFSTDTALI